MIYLCEKAFDEDRFIEDVNEALKKENNIIIAVSEGVKTADGNYVGEETKSGKEDVFGHKYLSGVGKYLEGLVGEKIGCKVRSVELNILQRCAGYMLSETDIMESRNLGAFAAVSAIRGKSGKMSAVRRKNPAVQDSFYLSSYGMSCLLFLGFTGFFDDCEMK